MTGVDTDLAAEALFCSNLQPSEQPGSRLVRDTVFAMVFEHGEAACADLVAQEFGDHAENAARRMVWARQTAGRAFLLEVASC